MTHKPYSTVNNEIKPLDHLIEDTYAWRIRNTIGTSRSVFDTQDEVHSDVNFTQSNPQSITQGVKVLYVNDDSGGSAISLPPGGKKLWYGDNMSEVEEGDVVFIAIKAEVKFNTVSAELQFFIESADLPQILTANTALEVPNSFQWGIVQPFFVVIVPKKTVFRIFMKATDGNAEVGERRIDIYKPFDRSEEHPVFTDEQLIADLHTQPHRNGVQSVRNRSERLSALYTDTVFDGPGGAFTTLVPNVFNPFTISPNPDMTLNLLEGQLEPFDETTNHLVNIEPDSLYLITVYFELREFLGNESTIFRIREVGTNVIVSGSTTSEDATVGWNKYGLTIFFSSDKNSEGKKFVIEILHKKESDLGSRAIQIVKIA